MINTSLLLVGLTAKNAVWMKPYLGKTAYTISCLGELYKKQIGNYDIEFDDGKIVIKDLST